MIDSRSVDGVHRKVKRNNFYFVSFIFDLIGIYSTGLDLVNVSAL